LRFKWHFLCLLKTNLLTSSSKIAESAVWVDIAAGGIDCLRSGQNDMTVAAGRTVARSNVTERKGSLSMREDWREAQRRGK